MPYRASPRWQPIKKLAYTYVLAAERYEWCASPGEFKRAGGGGELTTKSTKDGDLEVKGDLPEELLGPAAQPKRPNKVAGEVTFTDHQGREIKLRPTFSAAMEIETALGGLDALRLKLAAGGAPGIPGITFRELGVLIAAGVRATGEERIDAAKAAEFAFNCGRDRLRQPLAAFLRALVDGGKLREDDLKNAASSNGSLGVVETASAMFEEIAAATRSDDTSA